MWDIQFERTGWLYLLLALFPLVLLLRSYWQWRSNAFAAFGKHAERWMGRTSKRSFWLKNSLLLGAMALLLLAMANPEWRGKTQPQKQTACDVIIAFDISRSMLANDLRPSRLVRARLFSQELLRELSGNRIGLLFFAGDAFLSMPLSTDYATLNNFLAEADPDTYSAQGTNIGAVVNLARKSFDPDGGGRALVIITDGEDHEDSPPDALEDAFNDDGIVTFVVGAGTPEGGNIPMANGRGLLRDSKNEVVFSKMNTDALDALALAGNSGMKPYLVSGPNNPASQLAAEINLLKKKEVAVRSMENRQSGYQWLLLPAIMLLMAFLWARNETPTADK